jgi:acetyl esterase
MKRLIISLIVVLILKSTGFTQTTKHILYKKVDTSSLYMDIIYPKTFKTNVSSPAVLFFYGGGWYSGSIKQFEPQAKYFAERGMITIMVDYRVATRHKTTPFESLKDAKSAMRYVRSHAKELGINPDSIVAGGGSAGGHLAAATALIKGYNEASDNLSISCIPNALMLYNPVIDNGPGGYGFERIGNKYKDFSPLHNIEKGAPPTIIMIGNKDNLIPVEAVEYYKMAMTKVGGRCELNLFEGQGHGFFNKPEYLAKTMLLADQFLKSLGYIKGEPLLDLIKSYETPKK